MSIIHFIVMQKIERIKELLLYEDLPLSEIAEMLHYKNEQLLAAQFKKYTGLTPNYFKQLKYKKALQNRSFVKFLRFAKPSIIVPIRIQHLLLTYNHI
ncbi:hypothetical protein BH23BAC3_BH23BAC3_19700 [soil metagenome]